MNIKDGMTTSEWKALIGFIAIGLVLVLLKRYVPEIGIDEAIIQAYWIGGGMSTGLYSIGRGVAKTGMTALTSEYSQPVEHDPQIVKAESEFREALIKARNKGVNITKFIK